MKKIKPGLMVSLLVAVAIAVPLSVFAQDEEPPRGVPVDVVVCAADPAQSYSLYLPTAYNCSRRWPIIYIFDPGARGPIGIGAFRAAAEKYGYILVCSNNSRNGPWEPVTRAVRAVWDDTQQRFCIDNDRVYSAGFSGGAQVALTFGLALDKPWAGAISCCGGLPDRMPVEQLPKGLAVFVATGLYDFNYWPSRNMGPVLDKFCIANRLLVFRGDHAWLPETAAMDAVSWLELMAMKKELRPKDDGWIAAQLSARLDGARELEQKASPAEAHEAYLALAADFRGLGDVKQAESAAARLNKSTEIEKYRLAQKEAERQEAMRFSQGGAALAAYMNAPNPRERRRFLDSLGIPALRRQSARGDDAAGLAARRLLGLLLGRANVAAYEAYDRNDMKTAGYLYELSVLIQPESRNAWLNLACVRSRLGEKKDALRALETAVRLGLSNWQAIEKDPDFEAIRQEKDYIRLLEALKKDNPAK